MAYSLPDKLASHIGWPSEAIDKVLGSRVLIPFAVVLLVVALSFFAYAVRGYMAADCYAEMHKAGLDRETVRLFDDVGDALAGLRRGTATTSKWGNREFQDKLKEAQRVLADGRRALTEREPLAALGSVVEVEKALVQAKSLATDRVNFILSHQDPADYDAYEKYRLEGKNLVAIVKELDATLEALDGRSKQLPKTCDW